MPALLGEQGRQELTEQIYSSKELIWDGTLESEMERSPARDALVMSLLRLLRMGRLFFGVEEEMGVKQDACNIPLALQHQMLIQAALSVLTLVLAALAMLFFSITVSVPFLLCAVLLAFSAFRLYNIGRRGQYLCSKARC